jgi:hypothetical protein
LETPSSRAARWFAGSGIQEPSGGVARYYRTDLERNHPISTEITGYAVSALLFLDRPAEASAAARFLARHAWSGSSMPFEIEPVEIKQARFTYFFDCGIIARGLLAQWRATRETEYLDVAAALGNAMLDFAAADGEYQPVLTLPDKQPAPRDPLRWSQCPGCYQLKSALAWWELFEATGNQQFRDAYDGLLVHALRDSQTFLPGHHDPLKVVDRLHAYLYFLEGLLPSGHDERCRIALCKGISRVACYLERTASEFERSDVYAQLLRIRIFADALGIVPLDRAAAEREAGILSAFQAAGDDPRIAGGFYFGRNGSAWLPYVNPVSTAFAVQALALWGGSAPADWHRLI